DSLIETLSQSYQPWRARLIAMTETTRAYAQGNRTMWGASGVTDGMEWRTGQDDIVCLICRPLAGKKTTLDGTFPGGRDVPPAHPGCRCHIYPVIGSITNDEAREYRASGQMSQAELDQVISDFEAGKHLDLQKTNFDAKLAYIAKVRGFDALPEVISDPNLFEAVLKEKEMRPLYRGVVKTETLAVEDMLAAFKHGDCYYGRGLVGNGVYFSPNLDIAKVYAEGDLTAIIQVGLRKEARLISWQDLVYEYDAAGKEILESFGKAYFDRWSAAFEDISTFAVVRGYDGILASTIESHHILLNRTALIVQG
ncbi:MAG: minor head protein, partial [uncultured bacterium]